MQALSRRWEAEQVHVEKPALTLGQLRGLSALSGLAATALTGWIALSGAWSVSAVPVAAWGAAPFVPVLVRRRQTIRSWCLGTGSLGVFFGIAFLVLGLFLYIPSALALLFAGLAVRSRSWGAASLVMGVVALALGVCLLIGLRW